MREKENETQGLKQEYSDLENQYNELKSDYDNVGEQFDKDLNRAVNTRGMMVAYEKDREIQRLQEQINQLLSHQSKERI